VDEHDGSGSDDLAALRERAKELRCLYEIDTVLARREHTPQVAFAAVLAAIPAGWQYPDDTTCRIEYFGRTHARTDFVDTPWRLRSPIAIARTPVGAIEVVYRREHPPAFEGPFLIEERELLDRIAARIGEFLEWKHRELGGERIGAEPEHWRWRERFVERIAACLDPARFDVERLFLYGSTSSGAAGVGSDIDLLVVHRGDPGSRRALELWLEGWSLCLAETSRQLYGIPSRGVLDVHFVAPAELAECLRTLSAGGAPPRELTLGPVSP
jgi:hypothetical protein